MVYQLLTVIVGFAGGHTSNPKYLEMKNKLERDHAEVVRVVYHPDQGRLELYFKTFLNLIS